jgi:cardiolipin synthase
MYRALPNIVTVLRILAVPVVVVLMMDNALAAAFWVILVAGLSDGLDGFLAKRLDAVTRLGTYLDPIADKALLIAVFVCLALMGFVPGWIVCLVIMRDLLIISGVLLSNVIELDLNVEPITVSKLNTILQIALVMSALTQPALELELPYLTDVLLYLAGLTTIVSGTLYLSRWTGGFGAQPVKNLLETRGK